MGFFTKVDPQSSVPDIRYGRIIGLVVLVIVVLILMATCIRTVGTGQVGIETRFGKVTGEVPSGLHFILPWEGITRMNVQNQKVQIDATAATQDLQQVTTTVALNYNLTPSTAFDIYKNIGVDYQGKVIDPIMNEDVKAVTSQYNAADLVQQRPAVEAKILTQLQSDLTAKGFTVDNFSVVNFAYSDQFATAIENKQVEAQNVQAAQYKLQQAQLNAQANQVQDAALTPQILEQQAISKWDGKLPANTVAGGSTLFSIPVSGQ